MFENGSNLVYGDFLGSRGDEVVTKSVELTFEQVSEVLAYDPASGIFTWRISPCRRMKPGDEAGSVKQVRSNVGGEIKAYRYLTFAGNHIPASRVAWLLYYGEWPTSNVMFKDGDSLNLRIDNLIAPAFPTNKEIKSGRRIYKMSKEAQRHYGVNRYYGLTGEQYGEMVAAQKGVCSICAKPETAMLGDTPKVMHVDHDHETGMIRDLLCGNCNNLLGHAKDNPETLRAAADYIERHAKRTENVTFIKTKGAT